MQEIRKVVGGPAGQFLFLVLAGYFALVAVLPAPIVISLFDAGTVGVGIVFCAYVGREVWRTLKTQHPERASLWATGAGFIIGSTVIIRLMRVGWSVFGAYWLADHWTFGIVTATQWAGFVLCLAALAAPDNSAVFRGTYRPMRCAAILAAIAAVVFLGLKLAW